MIAGQLKETPEASEWQIAAWLGVSDKTDGAARADLEGTAEIPQLTKKLPKTTGKNGKQRRKPAESTATTT